MGTRTATDDGTTATTERPDDESADRNEVRLVGRISGGPERRTLPSGDEVLALRVVVRRDDGGQDTVPVQFGPAPPPGGRPRAGQIGRRLLLDAQRFADGDRIHVVGSLRRRWWEAGGARRSRIEVAAARLERL